MDCMREQFGEDLLLDGRFQTISPLNHGSFGMVFVAKDLTNDDLVAVKCLPKAASADFMSSTIAFDDRSEELLVHSRIADHPNIVNLIHSFDTEHHTYLVLEFCSNGDLYEAIRQNKGPLETEHVREFTLQLINAVEYMHSKGVYHRDIKPENIFLTLSGTVKLGDFGLATTDAWSTEFAVGSDRYMAPEQFTSTNYHYGYAPAAADAWAIGICLLNVLFSRNPFATPTASDPLFADFLSDRQSLFDVFPTMSQDTFNVLSHCLAMDPEKRSLSAMREALQTVISFTTDDEALDEFCTEERDPVRATLNREPLRTPSITSPQIDNGGCFPWAKALKATPQKATRQLSVIDDTESYTDELFPETNSAIKSWYATDPDSTSLNSTLDSGLGMSYKSANISSDYISYATSRPVPISASLPTKSSKAMASVYGNTNEIFSKSWSDLWEEEEEEEEEHRRSSFEDALDIERASTVKPIERTLSAVTPALEIKDASRRPSTPRAISFERGQGKDDVKRQESTRRRIFSPVRSSALPGPQRYSSPSKRSIMDKWSALGNLRRGDKAGPETTQKPAKKTEKFSFASFGNTTRLSRSRDRAGSWRKDDAVTSVTSPSYQHTNSSPTWNRKGGSAQPSNDLWHISQDWRQSPAYHHSSASPSSKPRSHQFLTGYQLPKAAKQQLGALADDDIGDLEWVGGWNDLHL